MSIPARIGVPTCNLLLTFAASCISPRLQPDRIITGEWDAKNLEEFGISCYDKTALWKEARCRDVYPSHWGLWYPTLQFPTPPLFTANPFPSQSCFQKDVRLTLVLFAQGVHVGDHCWCLFWLVKIYVLPGVRAVPGISYFEYHLCLFPYSYHPSLPTPLQLGNHHSPNI